MNEPTATPTRPKRKYVRRQPAKAKMPPAADIPNVVLEVSEGHRVADFITDASSWQMPPAAPPRPDVRPTMRAEDPRESALRRAEEIRGHGVQVAMDDSGHMFDVDPSTIPPGWYYEFKTYTVLGARDPDNETSLRLKGWTPVPAGRHPELVPIGTPPDSPIIKKGQMLMEIPAIIAEERQAEQKRTARLAVAQKEAQLSSTPAGSLERTTDPRVHKINKTVGYEQPIPVTPAAA